MGHQAQIDSYPGMPQCHAQASRCHPGVGQVQRPQQWYAPQPSVMPEHEAGSVQGEQAGEQHAEAGMWCVGGPSGKGQGYRHAQ
ncbi:hypothetical protein D3C79_942070 [compost metagenome]